MKQRLSLSVELVRALATDDAYERYLEHHRQAHAGVAPHVARREFYPASSSSASGPESRGRCC